MSELLTVRQVADAIQISEDAVVRRFAKLDGVVDLGRAETRDRRQYRILRIPKTVVERYLSQKAGHPVRVEISPRAERRRKSVNWEDKAILNLAKAGLQNECKDRAVYRRIAERARLLAAFVPENMWKNIDWTEED